MSIFDYPPVERKYVAVRRYRRVIGEKTFDKLLARLGLTYYEFVDKYGEQLIGNPNLPELNNDVAEVLRENIFRRKKS